MGWTHPGHTEYELNERHCTNVLNLNKSEEEAEGTANYIQGKFTLVGAGEWSSSMAESSIVSVFAEDECIDQQK